ncbi:hypothetical protein GCM10020221_08190 [Streptomyces thioluteus]|uniref:Transposase-like Mu C-terminal domain-containing protein n=1 Tax=Streptomyces thioluteus TaxID=66431 RepID=A0ABP6IZ89_STRTU
MLLEWVAWWNTSHRPDTLGGKTPLEAWRADPTPISDVQPKDLATFSLEDDGRTHTLTTSGIRWRRRDYLADWMVGNTGTKVIIRYLPHHDDQIEVFDTTTGHHLGPAFLAEAATPEQIRAVRAARTAAARRLKADLKAAEKLRRQRFEAVTTATAPKRLGSLTTAQADAELDAGAAGDRRSLARPDYIPHGPAPDTWAHPIPTRQPDDEKETR